MICMYKIGVIGDYDSICGFAALGLDIYPANTLDEAHELLVRLAGGDYGIIYITEQYISKLEDVMEKYREQQTPAIVPIPGVRGANGFGTARVKKYVEQAVGSDIIFNDEA